MAGYMCGGCDGAEPAVMLITPLNGAETLAIGEQCMPVTLCGILAGTIGVDAEALWYAAIQLHEAEAGETAQQAAAGRQADGPEGEADESRQAGWQPEDGEAGPEDSVFVRVPHGTPDEESGEEAP